MTEPKCNIYNEKLFYPKLFERMGSCLIKVGGKDGVFISGS